MDVIYFTEGATDSFRSIDSNCGRFLRLANGGNTVSYRFLLRVAANSAPAIVNGNTPHLVSAGTHVDYDAAQNGTTFRDPDGDGISYAVTLRGDPHGLAISGICRRQSLWDRTGRSPWADYRKLPVLAITSVLCV